MAASTVTRFATGAPSGAGPDQPGLQGRPPYGELVKDRAVVLSLLSDRTFLMRQMDHRNSNPETPMTFLEILGIFFLAQLTITIVAVGWIIYTTPSSEKDEEDMWRL